MLLFVEPLVRALSACGYEDREISSGVKAQETVYLLQVCGYSLGYRFKWELIGPFSIDLANDIYELNDDSVRGVLKSGRMLPGECARAVRKLASLKSKRPLEPQGLTEVGWMNLLACMHFFETKSRVAADGPRAPKLFSSMFEPEWIREAKSAIISGGLLKNSA